MHSPPPEPGMTPESMRRHNEALFERVIHVGAMAFGERAQPPQPPLAAPPAAGLPTPLIRQLPERLTLEQARARLPFALRLPQWAPEGFGREAEIAVSGEGFGRTEREAGGDPSALEVVIQPLPVSVHVSWRHADGRGVNLSVTQWSPDAARPGEQGITPVPTGAVTAVNVQGTPAALVARSFYFTLPAPETGIRDDPWLVWEAGGFHYSLHSFQWPTAGEALIRMAESVPVGDQG